METRKRLFDGRASVPERPVRLTKPKTVRIKPLKVASVAAPVAEEAPHKPKCIYGGHLTPAEKRARYDDEVAWINAHADELNAFMEGVLEDQADVFEELDAFFAAGGSLP